MKYSPRFVYTFTPGSSTLDLSNAANAFNIKGLVAVIDVTAATVIYAVGTSGLGYSAISGGNVLTLQASMTGLSGTDTLQFFYDDGSAEGTDPDFIATGNITATDAVVGAPAGTGAFLSGASTANSYVFAGPLMGGDSAWNLQVTGSYGGGTLYFEGTLDSTTGVDGNWIALNGRQTGVVNTNLSNGTTVAGMYRGNTSGIKYFRVRLVGATSPSLAIILRIAGGVGAVFLNAGIPSGSDTIGSVGLVASGVPIVARQDGFLDVKMDPTSLFEDTFETLDTTNSWTTGGTTAPTAATGALSCTAGTAANATSYLQTQPRFINGAAAYLQFVSAFVIEAGVVTGNQRFWGLGVITAPTLTVPITNGAVFEIDNVTGGLFASVYSNGARTQSTSITRPSDGGPHRYSIYFRASRVYYELDNVPVASLAFPNPAVDSLGIVAGSINGASTLGTAAVLAASVVGVGDTGRNNQQISDGTFPWRKASVKPASTAAVTGDSALVTTPHPSGIQVVQGYQPTTTTGSITASSGAGSIVGPITMQGINVVTVGVYGTYTGVTFVFEATSDGTNWFPVQGSRVDNGLVGTGLITGSTANLAWDIPVGAWSQFRVRATAFGTGPASVFIGSQTLPYDPAPSALAQGLVQPGTALPTGPTVAPVLIGGGSIAGGTNATTATVKAASTAAASTDTALVVTVSPIGSAAVAGDTANAATDAGAPVKIGGQARTTNPTAVSSGQRVNAIFDKLGKQIVVGAVRDLKGRTRTNIAASTAETTIVTAGTSGVYNDLYGLIITNNSNVQMSVTIRDSTAGVIVAVYQVPGTDTRGMMLPVDSAIPQSIAASAWTATCTPNAVSVDITALFVQNI